jgi:hypothetical protein
LHRRHRLHRRHGPPGPCRLNRRSRLNCRRRPLRHDRTQCWENALLQRVSQGRNAGAGALRLNILRVNLFPGAP